MADVKAKRCDRCGKLYEISGKRKWRLCLIEEIDRETVSETEQDLCPDCQDCETAFMEELK